MMDIFAVARERYGTDQGQENQVQPVSVVPVHHYVGALPPGYEPPHPGTPTPDHILEKIIRWDCGGCSTFDVSHGIYWCAGEPGRFRNIARMQACPKTIN